MARWHTVALVALVCLLASNVEADRHRSPPIVRRPRLTPILECIKVNPDKTYTAYFGYQNDDGDSLNITVGSGDNNIYGFSLNYNTRLPWFFRLWQTVPGLPGRSPPYPNSAFTISFPLYAIGFWSLCGRILIITQWGPSCSTPDTIPPVFSVPKSCPATYYVTADPGSVEGGFTQCFQASDNDKEGGVTWENTFQDQSDDTNNVIPDNCIEDADLQGLGLHDGSVTARDRSGNAATCELKVYLVDGEKPALHCPANLVTAITDSSATTLAISGGSVTATATDNNPAATISYKWYAQFGTSKNSPQYLPTANTQGTTNIASGNYKFGTSEVTFSASDSGTPGCSTSVAPINTATCQFSVTVQDHAAPYFTVCPSDVSYTLAANAALPTPSIVAKATDTLSKVTLTATRTFNGVTTQGQTDTQDCTGVATVDGTKPKTGSTQGYPVGVTTVTFTATDAGGYTAQCIVHVTVNPVVPQFTTCPTSQSGVTAQGSQFGTFSSVTAVAPSGFTISSKITPPSGLTVVVSGATGPVGGSYTGGANVAGQYPVGATSVTFTATSGSTTISCSTITLTVADNQAPTIACPGTLTNGIYTTTLYTLTTQAYATVPSTLVATGSDNFYVKVSNTFSGSVATSAFASGTNPASVTSSIGATTLAVGTYTGTFTADDGVSTNAKPTCTLQITVKDNVPPSFDSCPGDVTVNLNSGETSRAVGPITLTGTDNTGVVVITYTWTAGSSGSATFQNTVVPATYTTGDGSSSTTSTVTFSIVDQYGNPGTPCTFHITVNSPVYCSSSTCGHGGVCSVTTTSGFASGHNCDCSATFCYATQTDCQSSTFPFPTLPSTTTTTVSACSGATVTSETTSCAAASVGQGVGITRTWELFAVVPATTDTTNVLASLSAATDLNSVTFAAADLAEGATYTIRIRYTYTPTGESAFYDTNLAKLANEAPAVTISGPPTPYTISSGTTTVSLTGSSTECSGAATPSPSYAWSVSPSIDGLTGVNTPTLVIPVSGVTMNQLYTFQLTVTDGFGNPGSAQYPLTFNPDGSQSAGCATGYQTEPPQPGITVDPNTVWEQDVPLPDISSGASCPTPAEGGDDTGCQLLQTLAGGQDHVFDASASVDPRNCGDNVNGPAMSFEWHIYYPADLLGGQEYIPVDDSGNLLCTGQNTPIFTIPASSLPDISTFPSVYWRVIVLITSNNSPLLGTQARFKFFYANSNLAQLSTDCSSVEPPDYDCSYQVTLPANLQTSSGGFATQDASSWTWTWSASPAVDLSAYGQGTSRLQLPAGLVSGVYYTFTATASQGTGSAYSTSVTLLVQDNSPTGGQILVNPSTGGAALTQAFLLSAPGWTTTSGALTYAFKYILGGSTDEVSLTSQSWSSTATVRLPAGQITIVVYVYNQNGDYVRSVFPTTLTVSQPTTSSTACWILSIAETLLAQAQTQQDVSTELQLVSYLADYLKEPDLQNVNSLVCDGTDKTAELQGLRTQFMNLLNTIAAQTLDSTQTSMLTAAMNAVVSNARVVAYTPTEAISTATTLAGVVAQMSSQGQTASSIQQMQSQVLSMVSQLVGWIDDCSTLDSLDVTMRSMFAIAATKGVAGDTTVSMSADNIQYASQTIWANQAQSATLGGVTFNFPAAALQQSTQNTDWAVNMINFLDAHVRNCRVQDVTGAPTVVGTNIFSVELMNPMDKTIKTVSGLSSPVTFSMPVRSDIVAPDCGTGAGALTCAWWDSTNNGWSSAGCQTTSVTSTTIQCSCSHLTEFAGVRGSTTCPDLSIQRAFRGVVAVYVILFALVLGLFFRTMRMTSFMLRENMLFTFLGASLCAIRLAIAIHYANFKTFPTGSVDVLAVIPYGILYWINGHYFKVVRIQRIESTEARVRWRVEPFLNLIQLGVFLGMVVLLAGIGMDVTSQQKMASVVSRIVAFAYTASNTIFFGYGMTIMCGFASGRSDVALTRAMTVVSFAALMETIFWGVYPINGYALFPATVCDFIALCVLMFRYRNPIKDSDYYVRSQSQPKGAMADADDDDDVRPELAAPLSMAPRSSEFVAMESPRRPSTQLEAPPQVASA